MNILVLAKNKTSTDVQFIDASGEDFFRKETNNNVMDDDHIARIMEMFDDKAKIEHVAEIAAHGRIVENDYNLSVSSYVEPRDTREVIDITALNAELKATVAKIDHLRADIDAIVAEIEGDAK